jgi:hypothetical protein
LSSFDQEPGSVSGADLPSLSRVIYSGTLIRCDSLYSTASSHIHCRSCACAFRNCQYCTFLLSEHWIDSQLWRGNHLGDHGMVIRIAWRRSRRMRLSELLRCVCDRATSVRALHQYPNVIEWKGKAAAIQGVRAVALMDSRSSYGRNGPY